MPIGFDLFSVGPPQNLPDLLFHTIVSLLWFWFWFSRESKSWIVDTLYELLVILISVRYLLSRSNIIFIVQFRCGFTTLLNIHPQSEPMISCIFVINITRKAWKIKCDLVEKPWLNWWYGVGWNRGSHHDKGRRSHASEETSEGGCLSV